MRRWLAQSMPERLRDFEAQQARKVQFHRLVADNRDKLRALFASSMPPDAMRVAKADVITEMKRAYVDLKVSWGGYSGYDQWFNQPLNNAALGSITLYAQWVPAFQVLLEQEGGSLPRFYQRVAMLAELPKTERAAALDLLLPSRLSALPSPCRLGLLQQGSEACRYREGRYQPVHPPRPEGRSACVPGP